MLHCCSVLLCSATATQTRKVGNRRATAASRPNFPHHLQVSVMTEVELDDADARPKLVDVHCGGILLPLG